MKLGAEYWDSIAERMNSRYVRNPFFEHKRNEVLRLINKWAKHNRDATILKTDLWEEALEPDHLLFNLAKKNGKVWGIDISPRLARMARQRAHQRGVHLNLCVSDVRRLAFKDNRFDLVISTSTLDHFPEIEVALKELHRVLKSKGLIILTLDNTTNLLVYLMFKLMKLFRMYPFFYDEGTYSLGKVTGLMRSIGFDIEDSTAIIHVPPLLPTIINQIHRRGKCKLLATICQKIIGLSEIIGKSDSFLKYLTGYHLAVKGIRK